MDLKSLTREDISKMSEEEKRDFVRRLIHNEDSTIQAVLFDVSTGEQVSIQEMIERKGEEEVVEMLVSGLMHHDAIAETISGSKIAEALERVRNNTATDEDYQILEVVKRATKTSPLHNMGSHLTSILLDFLYYYQERHGIAITCFDLDTIVSVIQTVNAINNPELETYKFSGSSPKQILDITDAIADDMLSTWEATLTTPYSAEMKYLASLSLMRKLSEEVNKPLISAEALGDILGFDFDEIKEIVAREKAMDDDNHECACDSCNSTCKPATYDATNGSNESHDENADMKNLLKEN